MQAIKIIIGQCEFNYIRIHQDKIIAEREGVIHVIDGESVFVIGLDDSKLTGKRTFSDNKNNVEEAIQYIDYIAHLRRFYLKHKDKGFLSNIENQVPVFDKSKLNALRFTVDEANHFAASLNDGESISTGEFETEN